MHSQRPLQAIEFAHRAPSPDQLTEHGLDPRARYTFADEVGVSPCERCIAAQYSCQLILRQAQIDGVAASGKRARTLPYHLVTVGCRLCLGDPGPGLCIPVNAYRRVLGNPPVLGPLEWAPTGTLGSSPRSEQRRSATPFSASIPSSPSPAASTPTSVRPSRQRLNGASQTGKPNGDGTADASRGHEDSARGGDPGCTDPGTDTSPSTSALSRPPAQLGTQHSKPNASEDTDTNDIHRDKRVRTESMLEKWVQAHSGQARQATNDAGSNAALSSVRSTASICSPHGTPVATNKPSSPAAGSAVPVSRIVIDNSAPVRTCPATPTTTSLVVKAVNQATNASAPHDLATLADAAAMSARSPPSRTLSTSSTEPDARTQQSAAATALVPPRAAAIGARAPYTLHAAPVASAARPVLPTVPAPAAPTTPVEARTAPPSPSSAATSTESAFRAPPVVAGPTQPCAAQVRPAAPTSSTAPSQSILSSLSAKTTSSAHSSNPATVSAVRPSPTVSAKGPPATPPPTVPVVRPPLAATSPARPQPTASSAPSSQRHWITVPQLPQAATFSGASSATPARPSAPAPTRPETSAPKTRATPVLVQHSSARPAQPDSPPVARAAVTRAVPDTAIDAPQKLATNDQNAQLKDLAAQLDALPDSLRTTLLQRYPLLMKTSPLPSTARPGAARRKKDACVRRFLSPASVVVYEKAVPEVDCAVGRINAEERTEAALRTQMAELEKMLADAVASVSTAKANLDLLLAREPEALVAMYVRGEGYDTAAIRDLPPGFERLCGAAEMLEEMVRGEDEE